MDENIDLMDPELIRADSDAVVEKLTKGTPIDPVRLARIRERSRRLTQETFEKHGLLDIAVPYIRELRGELPD